MPKRVTLVRDGEEWVATAGGDRITLAGLGEFAVRETADGLVVAGPDGDVPGVAVRAGHAVWVSAGGEIFEFRIASASTRRRAGALDADALSAPMPATVVRIAVAVGDAVESGMVLIALEAMKMELPIRAPRAGVVKAVHCQEGELVQPGTPLIEI